ncbi:hypothetical protein K470DRAFT_266713 [Piedraia hortae CBS 480.64]|uniref:Uncharacterized protein n=1 Tax=Piedraia hortae CBS 480.64 TaxID=1314780 RepID=A0A6A7BQT2_9PEZI|nr:hypothetical protein K470DRAFT_266713 [Piedraia hortae CBS 480.64]
MAAPQELPPPVPPKDAVATARSKRKREAQGSVAEGFEHLIAHPHTPKRSKQGADVSSAAEETPCRGSLRHKKKHLNLSGLRHADKQKVHGSKFREGDLTDKPGEKLPAMLFTRAADSEQQGRDEAARTDKGGSKSPGSSIFQFGSDWHSVFRPVAIWNRLYGENKQSSVASGETKGVHSGPAESVQSVEAGQSSSPVQFSTPAAKSPTCETTLAGTSEYGPSLAETTPTQSHVAFAVDGENPTTASKGKGAAKTRWGIKTPSLANLKGGLKRVRSELNLNAVIPSTAHKKPMEVSVLKHSQSRHDLKRQHKLSKRVSDLEGKLQQARRELDEALADAHPHPETKKYHVGTLRRPRFIPGKLPRLDSERVLLAQDQESKPMGDQMEVDTLVSPVSAYPPKLELLPFDSDTPAKTESHKAEPVHEQSEARERDLPEKTEIAASPKVDKEATPVAVVSVENIVVSEPAASIKELEQVAVSVQASYEPNGDPKGSVAEQLQCPGIFSTPSVGIKSAAETIAVSPTPNGSQKAEGVAYPFVSPGQTHLNAQLESLKMDVNTPAQRSGGSQTGFKQRGDLFVPMSYYAGSMHSASTAFAKPNTTFTKSHEAKENDVSAAPAPSLESLASTLEPVYEDEDELNTPPPDSHLMTAKKAASVQIQDDFEWPDDVF